MKLPIENVYYYCGKNGVELFIANKDFTKVRTFDEFLNKKGGKELWHSRGRGAHVLCGKTDKYLKHVNEIVESEYKTAKNFNKKEFESLEELKDFYKFMTEQFKPKSKTDLADYLNF